jgi:hypothetical protein
LRERLVDEREPDEPLLRREPPERDEDERDDELREPLELLRLREPDELLRPLELLRLRDDDGLLRRDDDEDDEDDVLFRRVDEDERRRDDVRRSAAGISSCATAFVSCGISFSRNFAMRSSSRRMPRAIFAVSLSPTVSASVSIDV